MTQVTPSNRAGLLLLWGTALAILVLPVSVMAVPTSDTVAVIGPPGRDTAAIVARAGGTILRLGGWDNVLVVRAGSTDFVARLYASGAWLVIDAQFATACTPSSRI